MSRVRAKGEGSVYFEKQRQKWRVRIVTPAGIIQKRFDSQQEAIDYKNEEIAKIQQNVYNKDGLAPFGQFVIKYLADFKTYPTVSEGTEIFYQRRANKIAPLVKYPIKNITTEILQHYFLSLKSSQDDKRKTYEFLKMIFTFAVSRQIIQFNPMLAVPKPEMAYKNEDDEPEPFSQEEIKTILNYLKSDHNQHKYYVMILLEVSTGCRIGELLGILKKWYSSTNQQIKIKKSVKQDKNNKTILGNTKNRQSIRTYDLSRKLCDILDEYMGRTEYASEYLFSTRTGTPISRNNMRRTWKRILSELNIPYRRFHFLRHTYITEMLAQMPLADVSAAVGHSKIETTLKYAHKKKGSGKKLAEIAENMYY